MSIDIPPDRREIEHSQPLSTLFSDDSVRIFAPDTFVLGAIVCAIVWVVVFSTGLFSAL